MMARTWSGLFALGAGLMHLAVGSAIVSGSADAGSSVVLGLLVSIGAAEIGWGIVVLVLERPWQTSRRPWLVYASVGLAVAAMVVGGLALNAGAATIPIAVGGALVIGAAVAAVIGWRMARRRRTPVRRRPGLEFAGLGIAAVLVAGLVTPALSATAAGLHAVPHDHGGVSETGHRH